MLYRHRWLQLVSQRARACCSCRFGVRGEHGFVGQNIDAAGEAARGFGDQILGSFAKNLWGRATCGLQTMTQVVADFIWRERIKVEAVGYAFLKLAYIFFLQIFIKLGLAEQNNLHQLMLVGLQIAE